MHAAVRPLEDDTSQGSLHKQSATMRRGLKSQEVSATYPQRSPSSSTAAASSRNQTLSQPSAQWPLPVQVELSPRRAVLATNGTGDLSASSTPGMFLQLLQAAALRRRTRSGRGEARDQSEHALPGRLASDVGAFLRIRVQPYQAVTAAVADVRGRERSRTTLSLQPLHSLVSVPGTGRTNVAAEVLFPQLTAVPGMANGRSLGHSRPGSRLPRPPRAADPSDQL
jgi:hypothetical protein